MNNQQKLKQTRQLAIWSFAAFLVLAPAGLVLSIYNLYASRGLPKSRKLTFLMVIILIISALWTALLIYLWWDFRGCEGSDCSLI